MTTRLTAIGLLLAAVIVGGCVRYALVEPRTRTIADHYTVEPQISWSSATDGSWEVWTVDGPSLGALQFLNGLEDDEPLFRGKDEAKRAKFRKGMTASEIAELVVDSLAAVGAEKVTATGLRPEKFAGAEGFRFELKFQTKTGLDKKGVVVGAVAKERLYIIMYSGLVEHYFSKHLQDAERVIQSVRLK